MAHAYFNGKRVSESHKVILDEAARRGIVTRINQGRRTLAEQAAFYSAYLRYLAGGPWAPVAARPWGGAPHIKWNAEHHALDVNAPQPANNLAQFYRSLNVPVSFNVSGEPWHMDPQSESAIIRAAHSIKSRGGYLATLKPGMRHSDVRSLRYKLWDAGIKGATARVNKRYYGRKLRKAVQEFQRKHGLRADGIVGRATWAKLNRVAARD